MQLWIIAQVLHHRDYPEFIPPVQEVTNGAREPAQYDRAREKKERDEREKQEKEEMERRRELEDQKRKEEEIERKLQIEKKQEEARKWMEEEIEV